MDGTSWVMMASISRGGRTLGPIDGFAPHADNKMLPDYHAFISGVTDALARNITELTIHSDSLQAIHFLRGDTISERSHTGLRDQSWRLLKKLKTSCISYITRVRNKVAVGMANGCAKPCSSSSSSSSRRPSPATHPRPSAPRSSATSSSRRPPGANTSAATRTFSMLSPEKLRVTGPIYKSIPKTCIPAWKATVGGAVSALARALESNEKLRLQMALVRFLGLANLLLKKPKGTISKTQQLKRDMMQYHEAFASNLLPSSFFDDLTSPGSTIDADTKRIKRCEALAREGYLSRAGKALTTEDMSPCNQATLDQLATKFPKPSSDTRYPHAPNNAEFFTDSEDLVQFKRLLKSTANGSAGGFSQLTGDLLYPCFDDDAIIQDFFVIFSHLIDGKFPDWTHDYLTSLRLFALGTKCRPLGIGEWLTRTAGKILVSKCKVDINKYLEPLQIGVGSQYGAESVIHSVRALLSEKGSGRIAIKIDCTNAFNSINRNHAVGKVMELFPAMAKFTRWLYHRNPQYVYNMTDGSSHTIDSLTGVVQGDPLGGVIYCVGQHEALLACQQVTALKQDKDLFTPAYCDDIYLVGSPDNVYAAFDVLRDKLKAIDLTINPSKSLLYLPKHTSFVNDIGESHSEVELARVSELAPEGLPITHDGILVLGSPVGTEEFVVNTCKTTVEEAMCNLTRLLPQAHPQIANVIIRNCVNTIAAYMARTTPSTLARPALRIFDKKVMDIWQAIGGQRPPNRQFLTSIPLRHGGDGIRQYSDSCHILYYSSLVDICHIAAAHHPHIRQLTERIQAQKIDTASDMEHDLQVDDDMRCGMLHPFNRILAEAFEETRNMEHMQETDLIPLNHLQIYNKYYSQLRLQGKMIKTQNTLMKFYDDEKHRKLVLNFTDVERAIHLSNTGSGASAWLTTVPTNSTLSLTPMEFRDALSVRAGYQPELKGTCVCGKPTSLAHALSCTTGRSNIDRHNMCTFALHNSLLKLGYGTLELEKIVDTTGHKMMDIVITGMGAEKWLDMTVVNPALPTVIENYKSSTEAGGASRMKEMSKENSWKRCVEDAKNAERVSSVEFIPCVLEMSGRFGKKFDAFLNQVSKEVGKPPLKPSQVKWDIIRPLCMALQRGNSKMIRSGIAKCKGVFTR